MQRLREKQSAELRYLSEAADVTETDIIENDLPGNALSEEDFVFDIPAYGFKTFRVRYHVGTPAKVNITSVCSTKEITRSENLVIKSDTEASSIFAGGYESDCAKDFMNGREWASKGESNPWIKFTWDEPVTVKVLAIASRNNPADLVEKAEVYADGDDTPIAVFTGNPLNSDIENNRIVLDKACNSERAQGSAYRKHGRRAGQEQRLVRLCGIRGHSERS